MTTPTDFLGAVASNAGDEFHEIWAIQKSLELIAPKTELSAVTLEGVAVSGKKTSGGRDWDGVDCGLYFGGEDLQSSSRIELVQLKYSASSPESNWTPGRLIKSTSKISNNSVARRLGNAFKAAAKGKTSSQIKAQLKPSLVSNQPIGPKLIGVINTVIDGRTSKDTDALKKATGLSRKQFELFCGCLELKGGEDARSFLKADIIRKIASFTDREVSNTLDDLRQTIRGFMLPESQRMAITKGTVLTWFKVADERAIFPCPNELEIVEAPIPRHVEDDLTAAVTKNKLVCLYGGGGCGKSTTSSALIKKLPTGSEVVVFDCYGAGSYLDPSRPRHRDLEAFTQLSNEVSLVADLPFLFPHQELMNVMAAFRRRLDLAATILSTKEPEALLVIMADAADNSVFAASQKTPCDVPFVHSLVKFSELPPNVRVVVSTRESRIESLMLPSSCVKVLCAPFTLEEVKLFVSQKWKGISEEDIEQFHLLTSGNPRVLASACAHANEIEGALDLLRPNGKSLPDLFGEILKHTCKKVGAESLIDIFCAASSALPTPIPIQVLASLCDQGESQITEICDDLSPNVRITKQGFEFANEDFEQFFREQGSQLKGTLVEKASSLLLEQRFTSDYAAIHLFDVLAAANKTAEVFSILEEKDSTKSITDEVVRRRVDLRRLQTAVTIATNDDDPIKAGKTILIGAESIRTEHKVLSLLRENISLSAHFSEATLRHEILRNPSERSKHGPALIHLAKVTSQEAFSLPMSREYLRTARSWIDEYFLEKKGNYDWRLDDADRVAWAYSIYKGKGWKKALDFCFSWTPRQLSYALFIDLIELVLKSDGVPVVRQLHALLPMKFRWMVSSLLARAGEWTDRDRLISEIGALLREKLPEIPVGNHYHDEKSWCTRTIDSLLFFADLCAKQRCPSDKIKALIEKAWPNSVRASKSTIFQSEARSDFTLRAQIALCAFEEKEFSTTKAFGIPEDHQENDDEHYRESTRKFIARIEAVKELYLAANSALTMQDETAFQACRDAAKSIGNEAWRESHSFEFTSLRNKACRRVVDVGSLSGRPASEAIGIFREIIQDRGPIYQALPECFGVLLCHPDNFDSIVELLQKGARDVASQGGKASERAQVLIDIAHLLLAVSNEDAKPFFEQALRLIEETDTEAVAQMLFLTKASKNFSYNTPKTREVCSELGALFEHIMRVLDGEELPTRQVIEALTRLSTPVAMCIISRWTDVGLLGTDYGLSLFFKYCLQQGSVDSLAITALSLLLDDDGTELLEEILLFSENIPDCDKQAVLDELAERVSKGIKPASIIDLHKRLKAFAEKNSLGTTSFSELSELALFLEEEILDGDGTVEDVQLNLDAASSNDDETEISADIDATKPEAIKSAYGQLHFKDPSVFQKLSHNVSPAARTNHLDALSELAISEDIAGDYIEAVLSRLQDWRNPAVNKWAEEKLPPVMIQLGSKLVEYGWYSLGHLNPMLEATRLSESKKVALTLKILRRNGESLGSDQLYLFAIELIQNLPEDQGEDLFCWYLERVKSSISGSFDKNADIKPVEVATVPNSSQETLYYFLYRYLGDIDARVRWRAAHAVRSFMKMGREDSVGALLEYSSINSSFVMCQSNVPFHNLTAKLWLAMTLARIAEDDPRFIIDNSDELVAFVTSADEPHILIAKFVKQALLTADSTIPLAPKLLSQANAMCEASAGSAAKSDDEHGVGMHTATKDLRFGFDVLDTLPSWYDYAVQMFADVSGEDFLKIADRWICDAWHGHEKSNHWENEPRQARFSSHGYGLYDHRHGTYPTIERHSRYLEWHAMCVAVGELLKTRKVVESEDDYHTLTGWLKRWSLTYETCWLADLREQKPKQLKYWFKCGHADDGWFEEIDPTIFLSELSAPAIDQIVLNASRECKELSIGEEVGSESVQVSTAFVPPPTAHALLCALQIQTDPCGFYLKEEGDYDGSSGLEFPSFSITPSIRRISRNLGLDDVDPLRFGVSHIQHLPSSHILDFLDLKELDFPSQVRKGKCAKGCLISYTSWSDISDRLSDIEMRNQKGQFSSGHVTSISREKLLEFMAAKDLDLIFRVRFSRERGDQYGRSNQKNSKNSVFEKVYLLRQDGSIEDIDGHVGTGD